MHYWGVGWYAQYLSQINFTEVYFILHIPCGFPPRNSPIFPTAFLKKHVPKKRRKNNHKYVEKSK